VEKKLSVSGPSDPPVAATRSDFFRVRPHMSRPLIRIDDLERAIDGVVQSYDGPEEINNLESAALPNKRAIIEAFNHLKPVLYMGFYATRSLSRANLRHSLSEHLYPAYEILVEQIARAVTYEERIGRVDISRADGWNEEVVLRLFDSLSELRRVLNTDVLAAYDGDPAARSIEEIVFSYPAIEAITAYRIAHVLYKERVPMVPRIICEYAHGKSGIDVHAGAEIGERFFIDHGTGVVIGETSVIGRNVKIYQGVTLGALSTKRGERSDFDRTAKRHPTLEDDVTIYAGATILGGETVIGKGAVIGGNQWITGSVPAGAKMFGRPKE
jgi:serine O-acetyltransferase